MRFAVNIAKSFFPNLWSTRSFSQEGEDLALSKIFPSGKSGFYVEVGSHHPHRFSNTFLFYRRGWRGICIDPLPGTKAAFRRHRPRDNAIEAGVSAEPGALTYFMFNEPALNTFDAALAEARQDIEIYRLVEKRTIKTERLGDILAANLAPGQTIDFLSVDVEGLDLQVFKSNDWEKYRPRAIVAECLKTALNDITDDEVSQYLTALGYRALAKTGQSIIFVDQQGFSEDSPP